MVGIEKFSCCVNEKLCSFYRALNAIIRIDGRPHELVLLRLLEAHCLPILTYGAEVIHVSNRDDRRQQHIPMPFWLLIPWECYRSSARAWSSHLGRTAWKTQGKVHNQVHHVPWLPPSSYPCPHVDLVHLKSVLLFDLPFVLLSRATHFWCVNTYYIYIYIRL